MVLAVLNLPVRSGIRRFITRSEFNITKMPEPDDSAAGKAKSHFGFKSNPMDKLFVSHGGLSSLCFDRNAFFEDSFDVDYFLSSHTQRGISLEVLKDDLATYRKILQSALVQLIDREYADFVHLSSSLVGIDKNVERLKYPVETHLSQAQKFVMDIEHHIATLESKISRRSDVRSTKRQLQSLSNAMKCMRTIALTDRKLADCASEQERLPMLYRLSDLFLRIYEEEPLISTTAWFMSIREQLIIADTSFAKKLGDDLLNAVQSGTAQRIQDYSLVYQHINRLPVAYQVVAEGAVKPSLVSVILDVRSREGGLNDLLSAVFAAIEEKFYFLVYVDHADFALQAVWTTVSSLLISEASTYFLPDSPDQFHKNYRSGKDFMSNFVALFSVIQKNFPEKFWDHPGTFNFLEKWSLPVYYQIRFLEIGAPVEEILSKELRKADNADPFHLEATAAVWKAIERCWSVDVCLPELVHRFWKLTLLLCARYRSWLGRCATAVEISAFIPDALNDLTVLLDRIPTLPGNLVAPYVDSFAEKNAVAKSMQDSLSDTLAGFRTLENVLLDRLASAVAVDMVEILKSLQDIPRLYRKTNRDAPSAHSPYVDAAIDVVSHKLTSVSGLSQRQVDYCSLEAVRNVVKQYGSMALDLLDAVRRMEDSLKKLRKTRVVVDASGFSDDDKIRLQLALDFVQMEKRIQHLGLEVASFEEFKATKNRVLEEKPIR